MPGSVGIDLLDVERLERALARRPSLAGRLFTDGERAAVAERARPVMHLAARFCAKEAVAKALELEAWSPRDVEVVGGGDGPPRVRLSGTAAARAEALRATVAISLTHTRTLASAVALVEPGGADERAAGRAERSAAPDASRSSPDAPPASGAERTAAPDASRSAEDAPSPR